MEYIAVNFRKDYIEAVDEARKNSTFAISRAAYIRKAIEHFLEEKLKDEPKKL